MIVIKPEYNWSIPGVLKNALVWASRGEKVFIGKPVMTARASLGMAGTLRVQLHLREILTGIQANLLPPLGNEVLINFATQKFVPQSGRLVDEVTFAFLDSVMQKFIDHIITNK